MAEKHAMGIKKDDPERSNFQEETASFSTEGEHEVDAKQAESHPYREWTEEALYEKAEEAGIEGYADMDKEDLINALKQ